MNIEYRIDNADHYYFSDQSYSILCFWIIAHCQCRIGLISEVTKLILYPLFQLLLLRYYPFINYNVIENFTQKISSDMRIMKRGMLELGTPKNFIPLCADKISHVTW